VQYANTLHVWDWSTGKFCYMVEEDHEVGGVFICAKFVAVVSYSKVKLYENKNQY